MERVTFIEVLDRRGRVRERVAVERLPFKIGRGYHCDLILDDPYVDGLHAVLERNSEGQLQLRDAGSCNGIESDDSQGAARTLMIGLDLGVRVGRTHLRLRAPGFVVDAPIRIVARSAIRTWLLGHWSAALVLPAAWIAVSLYDTLRTTTIEFDWVDNLTGAAWGMLALGGWVGAWALLNRLLRHNTRFVAHSTIAFAAAAIVTISGWGFEWLRFFFESIKPIEIASLAVSTLAGAAVLLGHLTIIGVGSRRQRAALSALGFVAIFALLAIGRSNDEIDWASTLPYWSRLEPIDPSWLPVQTPETYFAEVQELADELEELALEAREEAAEDDGSAEDPAPADDRVSHKSPTRPTAR